MQLNKPERSLWQRLAPTLECVPTGALDALRNPVLRARRVSEVHRRMRQWLARRPPLLDNKGKELPPYMQLDTIKRPKFVKLTTGEVVEYNGP